MGLSPTLLHMRSERMDAIDEEEEEELRSHTSFTVSIESAKTK